MVGRFVSLALCAAMMSALSPAPALADAGPSGSRRPPLPYPVELDHDAPEVRAVVEAAARRAGVGVSAVRVRSATRELMDLGTLGCFPLRPGMAAPADRVVVEAASVLSRLGARTTVLRVMEFRGGRFCSERFGISRGRVDPPLPQPRPLPRPVPDGTWPPLGGGALPLPDGGGFRMPVPRPALPLTF